MRSSSARWKGKRVAFLSRHGRGHRFSPSEINYRANICALKMLGAERIISVSAVGSLREDLPPLEFLIPDQFFDRTRGRISTFFGGGIVAHVGFDQADLPGAFRASGRRPATGRELRRIAAGRTSAWKGRSFQPSPNRTPTASCDSM